MSEFSRRNWLKSIIFAGAVLGVAGLMGQLWADSTWVGVLVALGLLGWNHWQRQQMIDQLRHKQQHYRARQRRLLGRLHTYHRVVNALPDAVLMVERTTQRIQWFNSAATRLLGLHIPTDRGAALVSRLQPLPLASWLTQGAHAQPLLNIASPVNPAIRLHLNLITLSSEYGLLVARDVSQVLHLEQMRHDFVANVSHELRTPLTVIHGYLELMELEEREGSASISPMLMEMRQQSQRMRQLVDDLLTLTYLESAPFAEPEPILMSTLLHSLYNEAHIYGQHQVVLEDCAEVDLLGCEKELHSAFSNLVNNAVRHTPAGGRISVSFSGDTRGAVLEVNDTGPGIAPEHLPRLTERFYRVSQSRSRQSGGTGLGLAIVKHVLERHQARLEIRSTLRQGSTFSCYFPANQLVPRQK